MHYPTVYCWSNLLILFLTSVFVNLEKRVALSGTSYSVNFSNNCFQFFFLPNEDIFIREGLIRTPISED